MDGITWGMPIMSNVAYDPAFVLRVVALASVRGAPAAAKHFGVPVRSVRAWQAERVEDDAWKIAADLALSELTVEIAEGRNKGNLAIKAGILADKQARYSKPKARAEVKSPDEIWADRIEADLRKLTKDDRHLLEVAMVCVINGDDPHAEDLTTYMERRRVRQEAETAAQLERNKVGALLWRARSELLRSA